MVNVPRIAVSIESDDPAVQQRAQKLANRLHLPIASADAGRDFDLLLAESHDLLELREPGTRPGKGLSVDFATLNPRQAGPRGGFSRNQPLARAMGRNSRTVLDATAGLGHDAALLACMGFEVTAAERSAIIAALLENGLERALEHPDLRERLEGRLKVINADARDLLAGEAVAERFDVVYIDPMFPPKRKASALAKKSIRMVRMVVGDDPDAAELLELACRRVRRVVVKRPTYAPTLHNKPAATIVSKLVRYDIYLSKQGS